jgi:drug/metabolite transporter (DMT)-like permease
MQQGIAYALLAAALFGASTPFAKRLVGEVPPLMLAGLLYFGSGLGLSVLLGLRKLAARGDPGIAWPVSSDWGWLAGAILFGGFLGPILLMYGLAATSAGNASLLLNFESVFTALIAWFVFRENFDRRIALGMLLIVAGAVVLSWAPNAGDIARGSLLVVGACACWAIDNNLTRKVSACDAMVVAGLKGLIAGGVSLACALAAGQELPPLATTLAAALLGLLSYGVSLTLFVLALRRLGTARTGAYFAVAPFFGAVLAIFVAHEPLTLQLAAAGALMALGVYLHLAERHEHVHAHEPMAHEHPHRHDEHHRHRHDFPWDGTEPHTHAHRHDALVHGHPHFPDIHHRH